MRPAPEPQTSMWPGLVSLTVRRRHWGRCRSGIGINAFVLTPFACQLPYQLACQLSCHFAYQIAHELIHQLPYRLTHQLVYKITT